MRLSEIKIPKSFENSTPNASKYATCEKYYEETGQQDRYLVIDQDSVLIDGYIMYLVLKNHGAEYAMTKHILVSKYGYTYRKRNKYGKLVPPEKVTTYKEKQTTYVYGKHPNNDNDKEYMWRIPNMLNGMGDELKIGDRIYCRTRFGVAPVIVTRVEKKDNLDSDMQVKKVCSRKIVRDGELLKYDSKDGSSNVQS